MNKGPSIADYVPGSKRACPCAKHNCGKCGYKPKYCICYSEDVYTNDIAEREETYVPDREHAACGIQRHKQGRCRIDEHRLNKDRHYEGEHQYRRPPTMSREKAYVEEKISKMPKRAITRTRDGEVIINADKLEEVVRSKVGNSPQAQSAVTAVKNGIINTASRYM